MVFFSLRFGTPFIFDSLPILALSLVCLRIFSRHFTVFHYFFLSIFHCLLGIFFPSTISCPLSMQPWTVLSYLHPFLSCSCHSALHCFFTSKNNVNCFRSWFIHMSSWNKYDSTFMEHIPFFLRYVIFCCLTFFIHIAAINCCKIKNSILPFFITGFVFIENFLFSYCRKENLLYNFYF